MNTEEGQEGQRIYIYPPIWIMKNGLKYKYNIIDTLIMNRMLIITNRPEREKGGKLYAQ